MCIELMFNFLNSCAISNIAKSLICIPYKPLAAATQEPPLQCFKLQPYRVKVVSWTEAPIKKILSA